ncbi:hypothetical protein LG288_11070 [Idiomarina seosinensis]|uniref:hypothetical protein n=1 Tax=Idiomarina seosinensis TaxID=281739 RepID=UPI003850E1F6
MRCHVSKHTYHQDQLSYRALHSYVKALVLGFALLTMNAASAQEETDSDVVDTYVGIESPFRVICTSVNFGVWFVPLGDRGGESVVDLFIQSGTTDTDTQVTGAGGDRLAVIADQGYDSPLAGVCNVRGSLADNASTITISFEGTTNQSIQMTPSSHIFAQDLAAAGTGAAMVANLTAPEAGRTSVQITDGEAVFRVVGTLTIPNNITRDNYGAYRGATKATIIVDDGI